jgi:hypothetical protein
VIVPPRASDLRHNRESKTRAYTAGGRPSAPKPFEDTLAGFGGDARAAIGNRNSTIR